MMKTIWFEKGVAVALTGGTSAIDNTPRSITTIVKTAKPFFLRQSLRLTKCDQSLGKACYALNWASKICLEHCYRVPLESGTIILVIVNCRLGNN